MTKLLVNRALLEQAVDAMDKGYMARGAMEGYRGAMDALRAALDAPEVEPPWEAAERVDNGGQP